jgi:hypothetical protein
MVWLEVYGCLLNGNRKMLRRDSGSRGLYPFFPSSQQNCSHPQHPPKPPGSVVRLGAVVVDEHLAVAEITEEGTSQLSDVGRGLYPAGRFLVKGAQLLQRPVFFFFQQRNAHGSSHVQGILGRGMFFSGLLCFPVVTHASAAFGAFCRAIVEEVLARLRILADYIRFAAATFHFLQRPQFFGSCLQPGLYIRPFDSPMAVRVFFEAGF